MSDSKKIPNPTGKGGFRDHPENINREGAPVRGQSWKETIKHITDMTREEAIEYVGKRSRIGRLLRKLPPHLPIKDALVTFISIIHYGREPNARMFQALTDREEGKPQQSVDVTTKGDKITKVLVEYIDTENPAAETTPGTAEDQAGTEKVQRN